MVYAQWLIFLTLIPALVCRLSREKKWKWRYAAIGLSVGTLVAPISYGFIQMSYIPIIGPILGLAGMIGNLLHGAPSYLCLVGCSIIHEHTVLSMQEFVLLNIVSAVIFGYIYGLIGYAVDKREIKNNKEVLNVR